MLSAESHLSLKGALETMLTWTGTKSSRPLPEEKAWPRSRGVFSVVVTPDRIPKFCIPSLEVGHLAVHSKDARKTSLGLAAPGEAVQRPRATRSQSEWCLKRRVLGPEMWGKRESLGSTEAAFSSEPEVKAGDHSDPATRAALSLPHLPKITTPYGFLALGESPTIRRKESLFFGYRSAELRLVLSQKKNPSSSRRPSSPLTVRNPSRKWGNHSAKSPRPPSQEKLFSKQTPTSLQHTPSSERGPKTCKKKRLQLLVRKHLPIFKKFRSKGGAVDTSETSTTTSMNHPGS
ncbi:C2 calcium-dependent domain-containing protein 4C-like [Paroedura picta]|uniref:C2 calcium-dependent domain-containing protein 4C-like n=1 Tax=Paroedura picta TaxID=143630 RepID=UPI004056B785